MSGGAGAARRRAQARSLRRTWTIRPRQPPGGHRADLMRAAGLSPLSCARPIAAQQQRLGTPSRRVRADDAIGTQREHRSPSCGRLRSQTAALRAIIRSAAGSPIDSHRPRTGPRGFLPALQARAAGDRPCTVCAEPREAHGRMAASAGRAASRSERSRACSSKCRSAATPPSGAGRCRSARHRGESRT